MTSPERLKQLFEAAMMEPEPKAPVRMVDFPRNPNGSVSTPEAGEADARLIDSMDARSEMIERVNRMKEFLPGR